MKQMRDFSVPAEFSLGAPGRIESALVNRWLQQLSRRIQRLSANRRELLIAAAATCGIGLSVLLVSYLFLVQLAAYGW